MCQNSDGATALSLPVRKLITLFSDYTQPRSKPAELIAIHNHHRLLPDEGSEKRNYNDQIGFL